MSQKHIPWSKDMYLSLLLVGPNAVTYLKKGPLTITHIAVWKDVIKAH